jgi:phage shock protein B
MDDNVTTLLGLIACIMGVICLRYLKLRSRNAGALTAQERQALEQMSQTAQRLEQRVATLEQILDSEVPSWRSNPANFTRQAGHVS